MLALAFNNKKVCYFLTNVWNHKGYLRLILNFQFKYFRKKVISDKEVIEKMIPSVVHYYNQYMNGVDKADAAVNRYRYRHRNYRWTMVSNVKLYSKLRLLFVLG